MLLSCDLTSMSGVREDLLHSSPSASTGSRFCHAQLTSFYFHFIFIPMLIVIIATFSASYHRTHQHVLTDRRSPPFSLHSLINWSTALHQARSPCPHDLSSEMYLVDTQVLHPHVPLSVKLNVCPLLTF